MIGVAERTQILASTVRSSTFDGSGVQRNFIVLLMALAMDQNVGLTRETFSAALGIKDNRPQQRLLYIEAIDYIFKDHPSAASTLDYGAYITNPIWHMVNNLLDDSFTPYLRREGDIENSPDVIMQAVLNHRLSKPLQYDTSRQFDPFWLQRFVIGLDPQGRELIPMIIAFRTAAQKNGLETFKQPNPHNSYPIYLFKPEEGGALTVSDNSNITQGSVMFTLRFPDDRSMTISKQGDLGKLFELEERRERAVGMKF